MVSSSECDPSKGYKERSCIPSRAQEATCYSQRSAVEHDRLGLHGPRRNVRNRTRRTSRLPGCRRGRRKCSQGRLATRSVTVLRLTALERRIEQYQRPSCIRVVQGVSRSLCLSLSLMPSAYECQFYTIQFALRTWPEIVMSHGHT